MVNFSKSCLLVGIPKPSSLVESMQNANAKEVGILQNHNFYSNNGRLES